MKKLIKGIFKLGAYVGAMFGAYRLFRKYSIKAEETSKTEASDDLDDFELDEEKQ